MVFHPFGLGSCQSSTPFSTDQKHSNLTFQNVKNQAGRESAWHVATRNPDFLRDRIHNVERMKRSQHAWDRVSVHGNFHPLQVAYTPHAIEITHPYFAQEQPFWIDLIQFEIAAQTLATQRSMKLYRMGQCIESYFHELSGSTQAGFPLSIRSDVVSKNIDDKQNPFVQNLYSIEQESGDPLDNLWSQNPLTQIDTHEMRIKILNPNWSCPNRLTHLQRYQPGLQCDSSDPQRFEIDRRWQPTIFHFLNEQSLEYHSRWMCSRLAKAHKSQWTLSQISGVLATWHDNPIMKSRLIKTSQELADEIFQAYRMKLSE